MKSARLLLAVVFLFLLMGQEASSRSAGNLTILYTANSFGEYAPCAT